MSRPEHKRPQVAEAEERFAPSQQEAIIGWRYWRLRRRILERPEPGGSHRITYWLRAAHVSVTDEWLPNRAPHARCRRKLRPHRMADVPHDRCQCGYSAYPSAIDLVWDLARMKPAHPIVIGEVAQWGQVRGSLWLRAEFAYPKTLYVIADAWTSEDSEVLPAELQVYGVPVHYLQWHEFRSRVTPGAQRS